MVFVSGARSRGGGVTRNGAETAAIGGQECQGGRKSPLAFTSGPSIHTASELTPNAMGERTPATRDRMRSSHVAHDQRVGERNAPNTNAMNAMAIA
jgi:hypothetical protein